MAREADWWMNVTPSLPLAEATIEVEGLPIYYRTGGNGPPLLLLHGFTQIGKLFDPFLDDLGKHCTVIVPDLPGHGRSLRFAPGAWNWRAAARLMFQFLDSLGVAQVRGIGLSAGTIILMHMAEQRPDRMEAMVLMGGAHRWPAKGRDNVRGWYWENWTLPDQERFLRRHPGGIAQAQAIFVQVRGLADSYDDWHLSPERLGIMPTRTLIISGDRDWAYPAELLVEMYRAFPKAALWLVPGANHGAVWESEEAGAIFPAVVHRFFQGELTG